jgi:recombination protein RecT
MSENAIVTIPDLVKNEKIIESANRTLGSRGQQFLTSVLTLWNSDEAIQECEAKSLYNACLTAATLDLPVNKNLGFAHIIPYKNGKSGKTEAQFQMGWKGFVQLAMNSRLYETIGVREVHEDEIDGVNELTGEVEFDFKLGSTADIVGYMAYFVTIDGFKKRLYMDNDRLNLHAKKYSQSFKKGFGVWVENFEAMAKKTVVKLLLSNWGKLSTQLAQAIEEDQKTENGYIDNKPSFEVEARQIGEKVEEADQESEE